MDTVEAEGLSYAADCFALLILIYLHPTLSVEMSRLHRSNEILFDKRQKDCLNHCKENEMKLRSGRAEVIIEPRISNPISKKLNYKFTEEKDFS